MDQLYRQRITVYDVLSSLAAGMTVNEILADFPALTQADIQACLSRRSRTPFQRQYRVLLTHSPEGLRAYLDSAVGGGLLPARASRQRPVPQSSA